MLIPICAQFHYAYGDSPYANISGSPHVCIWGLPVCVQGSFLTCRRSFLESRIESEFSHALCDESEFCEYTTCTRHVQNMKSPWGSRSIPVCIRGSSESPYAYGDCMSCDPRMHTGIKINPRMHTEIAEIPVCIRGSHDT
jgi:hypothetical protein